jgi:hypothetical protein
MRRPSSRLSVLSMFAPRESGAGIPQPRAGPQVGGGTVLSEDPRTGEQLRAEIAALKSQIETQRAKLARRPGPAPVKSSKRAAPSKPPTNVRNLATPLRVSRLVAGSVLVSRRTALTMWLAPAILVVPAVRTAEWIVKSFRRGIAD